MAVTLAVEEVGPRHYRLTARAVPRLAVDDVGISIVGSDAFAVVAGEGGRRFGPTAAGVERVMTAQIELLEAGAEIAVSGRVWLAGMAPSRVVRTDVGQVLRAGPPVHVVTLPGGGAIDEVGP